MSQTDSIFKHITRLRECASWLQQNAVNEKENVLLFASYVSNANNCRRAADAMNLLIAESVEAENKELVFMKSARCLAARAEHYLVTMSSAEVDHDSIIESRRALQSALYEFRKRLPPRPEPASKKKDWVIRKNGYFYRPDRAGYTSDIVEAGLYTQEEAEREATGDAAVAAYPLEDWRAAIKQKQEDMSRLLKVMDK